MKTRRDFLAVTAASLATSLLPQSLLAQSTLPEVFSNANLGAYSQGLLTQANFERLMGSTFTAFVDKDLYAFLTLRSVVNLVPATRPVSNAAAVISLRGKSATQITSFYVNFLISGPNIPQGTYTLDHGILGRFAAFLVPGESNATKSCGATFTYIAQPATSRK